MYKNIVFLCISGLLFSGCVMPVGPSDDFSGMKNDIFSNLIRKNIQTTCVFKSAADMWPIYVGTDEYTNESFKILQGKKESEIVSLFHSNDGKCTPNNSESLQCTVTRTWKKKAQSTFARGVDWLYDFGNYNNPVLKIDYTIHLENGNAKSLKCQFHDLKENK
jgi:hypothetical protein